MRILEAQARNFRNFSAARFSLAPRLTAFIGPNGQGKTNLLEALYCVSALRPLRSAPRSELVKAHEASCTVELTVESGRTGLVHVLQIELRKGGRSLMLDGKRTEAADFLGRYVAVSFTPDDLEITKGGPEERRRFLDRAILNTRPAYLGAALRTARALKARNRLLSDGAAEELIAAYDAPFAAAAAEVIAARIEYVRTLSPRIAECFDRIARPAPKLELRYRATFDPGGGSAKEIEPALLRRLHEVRANDRRRGATTIGPHLDDLDLRFDGAPVRSRASQGQHRALVLALKLAEIGYLTEVLREAPVLLLDDISSELDVERSKQLFESLAPLEGQVVLTTTDLAHVPSRALSAEVEPRLYRVHAGTLEPLRP